MKKPGKSDVPGFYGSRCESEKELREGDSNPRPPGYEPDELTTAPSRVRSKVWADWWIRPPLADAFHFSCQ